MVAVATSILSLLDFRLYKSRQMRVEMKIEDYLHLDTPTPNMLVL